MKTNKQAIRKATKDKIIRQYVLGLQTFFVSKGALESAETLGNLTNFGLLLDKRALEKCCLRAFMKFINGNPYVKSASLFKTIKDLGVEIEPAIFDCGIVNLWKTGMFERLMKTWASNHDSCHQMVFKIGGADLKRIAKDDIESSGQLFDLENIENLPDGICYFSIKPFFDPKHECAKFSPVDGPGKGKNIDLC